MICAAAWTAGISNNMSWAFYFFAIFRKTSPDIAALNAEIAGIVARGDKLRVEIAAIIAEIEGA